MKSKRIKIGKRKSISKRQLRKMKGKFEKTGLSQEKNNLIKQHYKLQTLHPALRIVPIIIGLFLIVIRIIYFDDLIAKIISVPIGIISVFIGIIGRRIDIEKFIDSSATNIISDVIVDVGEIIIESIFDI